jgi:hypothetical protein
MPAIVINERRVTDSDVRFSHNRPTIGSKFNGKSLFYDEQNFKETRDTLPTLSDSEKFIQNLLLPKFDPKRYGEKPGEIVLREPYGFFANVGRKALGWL